MQISRTLEEAIEKRNLNAIYSTFYTIAHEDPNFSTGKFDDTLAYVKEKHIPGLMQTYNEKPRKSMENWNEDYWAEVASDLVDNFCEERIAHLRQIGRKLYPVITKMATQGQNPRNRTDNENHRTSNGYTDSKYSNSYLGEGEKPMNLWGKFINWSSKYLGKNCTEQREEEWNRKNK